MLSTSYIRAGVLSALLAIGAQAAPHNVKRADFEPAMDMDFPDPSIMKAGDGFYYVRKVPGAYSRDCPWYAFDGVLC